MLTFCVDHIPYVEYGESVVLNDEKGGVIELLKENDVLDLNAKHTSLAIPCLVCGTMSFCLHVNFWC
jgi:hypothetical protein